MTAPAAERGREVRLRLLTAAAELIPERGWTAVSTRVLAERAGVTPSVVHYHFSSLTALLNEAVTGTIRQVLADQSALLETVGSPAEAIDAMLASTGPHTGADPRLFAEAHLAATRDEALHAQLDSVETRFRAQLGSWLRQHRVAAPDDTAAVLVATIEGLPPDRRPGAAAVLKRLVGAATA